MQTLYEILGVPKDASHAVIRVAYKKLASQFHPDKNLDDPDATAKFQEIQQAYAILVDPVKRKRYDETGAMGEERSVQEMAVEMVDAIFVEIAESKHFTKMNYFPLVREKITFAKTAAEADIRSFTNRIEHLEYLKEHAIAGSTLIEALTNRQRIAEHNLAHAKEAIPVMEEALTYLDKCSWNGEECPPAMNITLGGYFNATV